MPTSDSLDACIGSEIHKVDQLLSDFVDQYPTGHIPSDLGDAVAQVRTALEHWRDPCEAVLDDACGEGHVQAATSPVTSNEDTESALAGACDVGVQLPHAEAEYACARMYAVSEHITQFVEKAVETFGQDAFSVLRLPAATVMGTIYTEILHPLWRQHPDLKR